LTRLEFESNFKDKNPPTGKENIARERERDNRPFYVIEKSMNFSLNLVK